MKITAQLPSIAGPGGQAIAVQIQSDDPAYLDVIARQVEDIVRKMPGTVDITNNAVAGQPELNVTVDRGKATDLGVTAAQIGAVLRSVRRGIDANAVPSGQSGSRRRSGDRRRRGRRKREPDPNAPLLTTTGAQIRLDQVADVRVTNGPSQIARRNRTRVATIGADVSGRPSGDASAELQRAFDQLQLQTGHDNLDGRCVRGPGRSRSPRFFRRSDCRCF